MPERNFEVKWPDGSSELCYSPSSTIENYLVAGKEYSLELFAKLCEAALKEASDRVLQKYGFACSSAADQLKKIKQRIEQFDNISNATVLVIRIS